MTNPRVVRLTTGSGQPITVRASAVASVAGLATSGSYLGLAAGLAYPVKESHDVVVAALAAAIPQDWDVDYNPAPPVPDPFHRPPAKTQVDVIGVPLPDPPSGSKPVSGSGDRKSFAALFEDILEDGYQVGDGVSP